MVSTEDILTITNNVCTMMLDAPIEPVEAFDLDEHNDRFTGCIQISGEWSGVVMLQTTGGFVSWAACKMLAITTDALELADRQDTLAELTNMIGGNIKSLVPSPSYLSLPSVTTGKEFDIRVYGTVVENIVPFQCNGQSIRILLCRAEAQLG